MKKVLLLVLGVILVLFIGASLVIGQVWQKAPVDDYVYPEPEVINTEVLKIGDSYEIPEILLGENEQISRIELADEDILKIEGMKVTALAEFFRTSAKVYISEIEVPKQPAHYKSAFLENYRATVRNLLGIEKKKDVRTELRDLKIYEYDFEIKGFNDEAIVKDDIGYVNEGDEREIIITLPEGAYVLEFHVDDDKIVKVTPGVDNKYKVTALKKGEANISFVIARNKAMSAEQYAEYVIYQNEHNQQVATDMNNVPVAFEQHDYHIQVNEKPKNDYPEENLSAEKVYFTTSKGFTGYTQYGRTYIDGILIVNKTYSLPRSYDPKGLTSETNAAFTAMKKAAAEDGINLWIVSGYRSWDLQYSLWHRYVASEGQAVADGHSARPGHSEHQAGMAMDINSLSQSFENTAEFKWLQNNAYKYGFILRYPKGKTNETGYIYEPWHYRYVGTDFASKLYNGGNWITVENYFGITSVYPD